MVGMPWERPGDKFGTSQGHPGRMGRFMWKFTFKGQNVRRTDDGTDGTCPRDRPDTNQGVSRQNSLRLLVFFFPQMIAPPTTRKYSQRINCRKRFHLGYSRTLLPNYHCVILEGPMAFSIACISGSLQNPPCKI